MFERVNYYVLKEWENKAAQKIDINCKSGHTGNIDQVFLGKLLMELKEGKII